MKKNWIIIFLILLLFFSLHHILNMISFEGIFNLAPQEFLLLIINPLTLFGLGIGIYVSLPHITLRLLLTGIISLAISVILLLLQAQTGFGYPFLFICAILYSLISLVGAFLTIRTYNWYFKAMLIGMILLIPITLGIINFNVTIKSAPLTYNHLFLSCIFVLLWILFAIISAYSNKKLFLYLATIHWIVGSLLIFYIKIISQLSYLAIFAIFYYLAPVHGLTYYANTENIHFLAFITITVPFVLSILGFFMTRKIVGRRK